MKINSLPIRTKKSSLTFIIVLLYISISVKAQKRLDLLKDSSLNYIHQKQLPTLNNDSLVSYFDNYGKNNPYVFAKVFNLKYNTQNDGKWIINADNTLSWLFEIKSKNAFSLNFTLEQCNIPKEAKLYIYSKLAGIAMGPYTSKNISKDSSLFIEPIIGDDVIFELDIPYSSDTLKSIFTITKIGHDFRNFYNSNNDKRGTAGSCEHDINCGIGLNWQKEKRSVVKIIFNGDLGTESCTGTLINNTTNNELPYLLTANHCIKDSKTAAGAIFYFDFENSICGNGDAKNFIKTLKGADLISTSNSTNKLDFTLLRLKTLPPKSYNPYYSGWSLKTTLESNVVVIHHPQRDSKKISYSQNQIINGSFTDNGYTSNSHWLIAKWDTGATEPGSSGCALFNSKHQIIGDLTGGNSECGSPYNDYFAKFYKSWNTFPDSANQLKCWLDPIGLNVSECQGYDPLIGSDNPISNVIFNENLQIYSFGEKAKGSWSGYNEPRLTICADKFSGIKNKYIYAIKFPLQFFSKSFDLSKIKLKIWNGITHPDSIIYEQNLSNDSIIGGEYYYMSFINRIKAGTDYFIGFDLSNLTIEDSTFLFTAKNRADMSNSLFYFYKGKWVPASDLGLFSSLGIEVYVTDNISQARTTTKVPEKLLSIIRDSFITFQSNELFHVDSISNYYENDWLQLHRFISDKGYWTGTNEYNLLQFAEKYKIQDDKYLSGIKLAVAINSILKPETKLKISILKDLGNIDSTIYSQEKNVSEIKANYYNVIKFKKQFKIDSTIYILISINDIVSSDTFAIYIGNPKDLVNKKHSYFWNVGNWSNFSLFNIQNNLGISPETWYSPYIFDKDSLDYCFPINNKILPTDIIYREFFIYPNPSPISSNTVTLNFGYNKINNVSVFIQDIFGNIVSTPKPSFNNSNSMSISTKDLIEGIYFVKVKIEDTFYKPMPLIISH